MNKVIKRTFFSKSTNIDPTNPLEIFKSRVKHLETVKNPEDVLKTFNSLQGLRLGFKHADENLKILTEGTVNYLKTESFSSNHLMLLVKDTANLGICDPVLWQSYKERFDKLLKTENLNKTTFLKTCLYFEKYCPMDLSLINFSLDSYEALFNQIKNFLMINKDIKNFEDTVLYDSLTKNTSQITNPKHMDIYYKDHEFNIDINAMAIYLRVLAESDSFNSRDNRIATYNLLTLLIQQLDKDLTKHMDINVNNTEFENYTEYTWRSIANLIKFLIVNPDIPNDEVHNLQRYLYDKQQHHLLDFKSFTDITQILADYSDTFKTTGFKIIIDLCNMIWHQIENEPMIFITQSEHDLLVFIQSVNILIEEEIFDHDVSFKLCKITDALIQLYKDGSFVKNGFENYIQNEVTEFNKFKLSSSN